MIHFTSDIFRLSLSVEESFLNLGSFLYSKHILIPHNILMTLLSGSLLYVGSITSTITVLPYILFRRTEGQVLWYLQFFYVNNNCIFTEGTRYFYVKFSYFSFLFV